MTTTADPSNLRAVTLGKARTVHASKFVRDDRGYIPATGYPLCGQAQGRSGQGTRPVNHKSHDLGAVTCAKCLAALAEAAGR